MEGWTKKCENSSTIPSFHRKHHRLHRKRASENERGLGKMFRYLTLSIRLWRPYTRSVISTFLQYVICIMCYKNSCQNQLLEVGAWGRNVSGSHIELQSGPSERSLVFRARDLRVTDRPPSLSTIDQSKAVVVGGIGKRPPPRRRSKNTQLEMPRSESCSPPEACFSHSLDNPGLGTPPMDAMSPHCQHTLGGELLSLETNFLSKHTGSKYGRFEGKPYK